MIFDWTVQTLIPLFLLAAGAVLLPVLFYRLHGPRLAPLAINLLVSALCLVALGTAIFTGFYLWGGADLTRRPAGAAAHLIGLGLSAAVVWLPILVLTGISLGIRSEARMAKLREMEEAGR